MTFAAGRGRGESEGVDGAEVDDGHRTLGSGSLRLDGGGRAGRGSFCSADVGGAGRGRTEQPNRVTGTGTNRPVSNVRHA